MKYFQSILLIITITLSWSQDTMPPETINDLNVTFEIDYLVAQNSYNSFLDLVWTPPNDESEIVSYQIYNYGSLFEVFSNTQCSNPCNIYGISSFAENTDFCFTLKTVDEFGNESDFSNEICINTNVYNYDVELFLSQYYEGSGDNNALEISVNPIFLNQSIDLSNYDLRINLDGGNSWSPPLNLSGTILQDENYANSYVIINSNASESKLIDNANLSTNNTVLQFDGNDPIGLFKDGILVDVFGNFNAGSAFFAQNVNLVRSECSSFIPTTIEFPVYSPLLWLDNTSSCQSIIDDGIGTYSFCCLLSNDKAEDINFLVEPNPVTKGYINIHNTNQSPINNISIFNLEGKIIHDYKTIFQDHSKLYIPNLNKGIYLIQITSNNKQYTKKIIVN